MNRRARLAVLMLAVSSVVCETGPPVVAPPALPLPPAPEPPLDPQDRPALAGFGEERVEVSEGGPVGIAVHYVVFAEPRIPGEREDRPEGWYLAGPRRTLRVSVEYDTASPEDLQVGDEVVIWLGDALAGVGERTAWVPLDVRLDDLVEEPERLTLRLSLEPLPGDYGEFVRLDLENDQVEVVIVDSPACCAMERLEVGAQRTTPRSEVYRFSGTLTATTDRPILLDITTPYVEIVPGRGGFYGPWPQPPFNVADWRVLTFLGSVRHSFTLWGASWWWDDPVPVALELDAASGRGLVYQFPSQRDR